VCTVGKRRSAQNSIPNSLRLGAEHCNGPRREELGQHVGRVTAMTFSIMASDEAIVYQDDVLDQSRTFEEHYDHYDVLNKLYYCLDKSGLTFKLASLRRCGHCTKDRA
jgi:hypothetical protein